MSATSISLENLLGVLLAADTLGAGQAIPINCSNYVLQRFIITNSTASPDSGVAIFTASSGGTALTSTASVLSLTNPFQYVSPTLAAQGSGRRRTETTLYFRPVTFSGLQPGLVDVYVYGDRLN